MNATVADCGLHEPFLESLANSEEENKRVAAQAGLLMLRVVDRFAKSNFQTEAESIQYQITAARNFLAGEALASEVRDLLEESLAAAGRVLNTGSTEEIFSPLIDYGRWLEGDLQLDAAIEVYDTLLGVGSNRDCHALTRAWRGRALRIAGRIAESVEEYRRAGELADATGNLRVQLRSRLGVAMGCKKSGNLPRADRLAREALQDARAWKDRPMEAMALHVIAEGLMIMGRVSEAVPLLFESYKLNNDEWDKPRIMSDIGFAFKRLGRYDAAMHAFSVALPGLKSTETLANTVAELLEIESLRGDRGGFDRWRAELERTRDVMPPEIETDFLVKLGQGLFLFGETDAGKCFLRDAMELAESAGLNTRYFEAEHVLAMSEETLETAPPGAASESTESAHLELDRVADELEALHLESV